MRIRIRVNGPIGTVKVFNNYDVDYTFTVLTDHENSQLRKGELESRDLVHRAVDAADHLVQVLRLFGHDVAAIENLT